MKTGLVLKEYIDTIILILGSGSFSWLVKWLIDRRKRVAEVSNAETDNEIKLYTGYQNASKDYSELVDFMSDKLTDTQKKLTKITMEFNDEIRELNAEIEAKKNEIEAKEAEIKVIQNRYAEEVENLNKSIEELKGLVVGFKKENDELREENTQLRAKLNGRIDNKAKDN